jgi:hypothetical protein
MRKEAKKMDLEELWLRLRHWVHFDTMENEADAEETLEGMREQHIMVRMRVHTNKEGKTEYVLYVKDADRDLARYYTGWRF